MRLARFEGHPARFFQKAEVLRGQNGGVSEMVNQLANDFQGNV